MKYNASGRGTQRKRQMRRKGGIKIKPSHEGDFHAAVGVPQGQKIPAAKIAAAKNSSDPHMRKMANFAANARHFRH